MHVGTGKQQDFMEFKTKIADSDMKAYRYALPPGKQSEKCF